MAEQKVWVGSAGPFLYDDADLIADDEGDLPGATYASVATTGQMRVLQAPTENGHVLRKEDVGPSATLPYETGTVSLTVNGFTTAISVDCKYEMQGAIVSLALSAISGTSNINTFSANYLPVSIRPPTGRYLTGLGIDAGVTKLISLLISASGIITFYNTPVVATSWTASGTKGTLLMGLTYLR